MWYSRRQVGTPHYMSPEAVSQGVAAGRETDLWSLSVVRFDRVLSRILLLKTVTR